VTWTGGATRARTRVGPGSPNHVGVATRAAFARVETNFVRAVVAWLEAIPARFVGMRRSRAIGWPGRESRSGTEPRPLAGARRAGSRWTRRPRIPGLPLTTGALRSAFGAIGRAAFPLDAWLVRPEIARPRAIASWPSGSRAFSPGAGGTRPITPGGARSETTWAWTARSEAAGAWTARSEAAGPRPTETEPGWPTTLTGTAGTLGGSIVRASRSGRPAKWPRCVEARAFRARTIGPRAAERLPGATLRRALRTAPAFRSRALGVGALEPRPFEVPSVSSRLPAAWLVPAGVVFPRLVSVIRQVSVRSYGSAAGNGGEDSDRALARRGSFGATPALAVACVFYQDAPFG
jgi:hypothetical protein